jgi:hypothetical protein
MKTLSQTLHRYFNYRSKHIGLKFDKNFNIYDEYSVLIDDQSFSFKMGLKHRKLKESKKHSNIFNRKLIKSQKNFEIHIDKIKIDTTIIYKPTLDDVLFSLVLNSLAINETFDYWMLNFADETNPEKALQVYLERQENYNKLVKLGINIHLYLEQLMDQKDMYFNFFEKRYNIDIPYFSQAL